ncbi:hypothetical protein P12x_005778 [Tundrisphaera lichenicola]|uniref:hypothetical protein n=1 Tax=Tundrisphaera lichenicola TaxID=2029860 RepID=UPI003EB736FA
MIAPCAMVRGHHLKLTLAFAGFLAAGYASPGHPGPVPGGRPSDSSEAPGIVQGMLQDLSDAPSNDLKYLGRSSILR